MFLEINGLTKLFGGLVAVNGFNMYVNQREVVGLIGPNGAGKTTLFNLITGIIRPTSGRVIFMNEDITGKKTHMVARKGIARTFQLNPLFGDFTVLQNISASFHLNPRSSLIDMYFNTRTHRRNMAFIKEKSMEILKLVGLEKIKNELAGNLPHGYQKMLGIARALAVQPKLLLLDEPIAGMNPDEIKFTMDGIKKTQQQGTTIVVVEHNMRIMNLCDRVVVINFGQKIAEGLPAEVRKNQEVIQAYFGGDHNA
ncbi:MAG: ABC transporter ATP-binding protein [Spirochaetes bacterium]|nr:ABC transporter ATP-binding protein [Spirochaetota bacterium]